MKTAHLLHNPRAGDEAYSDKELVELIQKKGFKCSYSSLDDPDWKSKFSDNDFLIITGGDGTVRRVVKELFTQGSGFDFPIALIPAGTANNIAKTLGVNQNLETAAESWQRSGTCNFDLGWARNDQGSIFFLESFGYGLFPRLMKEMKKVPKELTETPEKKIRKGLEVMRDLLTTYQAEEYRIKIDGRTLKGKFLMAEAMNIKSLGPNLILAPEASPSDSTLNFALVEEGQRQALFNYIEQRLAGEEPAFETTVITATEIEVNYQGNDVHADDEVLTVTTGGESSIRLYHKQLQFLV